ncbi:nicotinate phosphoribosyltransferase [bacterium]|nr:nicotinate phosphoribosyltransferase [bacterium]
MSTDSSHEGIPGPTALFVDRYEVTMGQAYRAAGMDGEAVFELFFRSLPPQRGFTLAAGLEPVLRFLTDWRFEPEDLAFLRRERVCSDAYVDTLADLRFTGEVHAVPEGTVVFPEEPLLQVVAPIEQAQLVETFLLNQINVQTVMASTAARHVLAAGERSVVDFGSRRCLGIDAAMALARASYLAGVKGTSNLLAGRRFGMPTFGTMAHSYVQAFDDEAEAFASYADQFPGTTLLVDTFDTLEGVDRVIQLATGREDAIAVGGIRLDSGDHDALAREARRRLDAAGLHDVRIVASGGLDEHRIAALVVAEAPIDGFGVGAGLGVPPGANALDLAYKLVAYDGTPRLKTSGAKETLAGRKQVFRQSRDGGFVADVVAPWGADLAGEPLLRPVMRGGQPLADAMPALTEIRAHAADQIGRLPEPLRGLDPGSSPYPVTISDELLAASHDRRSRRGQTPRESAIEDVD